MTNFTDMGFIGPITASSDNPSQDGFVAIRNGYDFHIHPTATPAAWNALQEVIDKIEIKPYVPPIKKAVTYDIQRKCEYPSIEDQLDKIYHEGIDAWKTEIKTIKDKYPKQ